MKILCIYHSNCLDGFGSALVVLNDLGKDAVEFHAGVHGEPPPDVTDRTVMIVDFSYKRDVLLKMADQAKKIYILDHHKSAEENLRDLPENVTTIFDMERSGVMITWDYLNRDKEAPQLFKIIQDRDLWKFEFPETKHVTAALFSYEFDFDVWNKLIEQDLSILEKEGSAIYRKQMKDIKDFIKTAAYRSVITGYDVPTLNAPYMWSSEAGHIMGESEKFAACYWDKDDGRIFSLRSSETTGIDVSKIASHFGGGGHKHAAGFKLTMDQLSTLSITLPESNNENR